MCSCRMFKVDLVRVVPQRVQKHTQHTTHDAMAQLGNTPLIGHYSQRNFCDLF